MVDRNKHQPMSWAKFQTTWKSHPLHGWTKSSPYHWHPLPTAISLPEHDETYDARLLAW